MENVELDFALADAVVLLLKNAAGQTSSPVLANAYAAHIAAIGDAVGHDLAEDEDFEDEDSDFGDGESEEGDEDSEGEEEEGTVNFPEASVPLDISKQDG